MIVDVTLTGMSKYMVDLRIYNKVISDFCSVLKSFPTPESVLAFADSIGTMENDTLDASLMNVHLYEADENGRGYKEIELDDLYYEMGILVHT